ncbi:Oidioi.mRNA.OKI2018_I69.chr1.g1803.t1.cds [Oikopleura dioica]|uniref:Oidioi.mRNA.OKI2018_I69.chr1.g1803.t1.cds n=1 Tax=Oikopleura dioica TaxID=34765 RepID=A0ABN7SSW4_OIKDI|nr:Oidioi.mRNA.OKI2018_I69.chr1.g1803.t1.cds [Oikopleura dioica]
MDYDVLDVYPSPPDEYVINYKDDDPVKMEKYKRNLVVGNVNAQEIGPLTRQLADFTPEGVTLTIAAKTGAGQKQQWFPYYQRQLIDRMEYITENQPKRPVAENKSSSLYPYKFYGEMTEWKGLDNQLNICRTNFGIKSARYFVYEHRVGKQYFERNNQVQRARMLRNQFLSGERLVSLMPAPVQPYLRLARYDKPIGYQLLFVPAFMGLVSGCQFTQLPDAYLMSIFAAGIVFYKKLSMRIFTFYRA